MKELLLDENINLPYKFPSPALNSFSHINFDYKPIVDYHLRDSAFNTVLQNTVDEVVKVIQSVESIKDVMTKIIRKLNKVKDLIESYGKSISKDYQLKVFRENKSLRKFVEKQFKERFKTNANKIIRDYSIITTELDLLDEIMGIYDSPPKVENIKTLLRIHLSKKDTEKLQKKIFKGGKPTISDSSVKIDISDVDKANIKNQVIEILNNACPEESYSDYILDHFNYSKLRSDFGLTILKKLGIKACPYCNSQFLLPVIGQTPEITKRETIVIFKPKKQNLLQKIFHIPQKLQEIELEQTTFNYSEKNEFIKAYCQLDHFLPKSKFPYLCVSLFNLIPACSYCNLYKSDIVGKGKELFNPYFENIHSYIKFTAPLTEANILSFIKTREISEIDISLNTDEDSEEADKARNHIDIFNLKGVYENHKDYVSEIHIKAYIYCDSFRKEIKKRLDSFEFKDKDWKLSVSEEEFNRIILGNYTEEKDLLKRPLAKLTRDISEELGLI